MKCNLCPRECGADRDIDRGVCGMPWKIYAARAALHMWEEPCISGERGSGTVFFSGCSLRCCFCQNKDIAVGDIGKEITVNRLAEIFLELQEKSANNINLVTPTHYVLEIVEAINLAKNQGLRIPIVYNTSAYEKVETLKLLDGLVDVYLPDMKYADKELSDRYSRAKDYPEIALTAIKEMVRQTGGDKTEFFNKDHELVKAGLVEEGIMKRGVIVRHLCLPGSKQNSLDVIERLYREFKDDIFISIMSQYTPVGNIKQFPELGEKLDFEVYEEIVDYAIELGVNQGFIQEEDVAKESFIPMFNYEGL